MKPSAAALCLFLFLVPVTGQEAPFSVNASRGLIDTAIVLGVNQDYGRLIPLLKERALREPGNPLFPFYLMVAYEAMMIDYETTQWEAQFDSLGQVSERGFRRLLKAGKEPAWMNYFLGILYVTQGAHELRFANYLTFTKSILKGISLLKKSVALDSTLNDAWLYLGAFNYARAELMSWLPFVEEDREEAVRMIETARQRSLFSREVSQQVLIGLYGRMGEVARAESLALDFRGRYPENRAVYFLLANVYLSKKRYAEAKREFEALKPLIAKIPLQYDYNRLSVDASLAQAAFQLGDYGGCAKLCDGILSFSSKDIRSAKFKKFARKYKARAEKKLLPKSP
jgi:tetratricopeptide (TPR) repeat protein